MKKRLLALALTLALSCALLSGCTGNDSSNNNSNSNAQTNTDNGGETNDGVALVDFTIGYPLAPVENSIISAMKSNRTAVAEACGGKLITEVFDFTPEGTVDAIEKMIQSGVDGLFVTPFAESIMPTISQMCQEAEVYFIVSMRTIQDSEVQAVLNANPYFLGYVYENDYDAGYALGKAFADAGGTEYALIGTSVGDSTGDARERGLAAAAEEYGLTQLAEVRAYSQASDATAAIESFMASFPELDGVIRVASTAAGDVNAIAASIEGSSRAGNFIFCTNDIEDGSEEYFERGTITMTLGDPLINDSVTCAAILCNAVLGTPLSDEPVAIQLPFPVITSAEEIRMQNEFIATDDPIYTAEEIRSLLIAYFTPEVSLESVTNLALNFSPAEVAARKS